MERLTDIINGWTFEETIKTAESLMEAEKNMFKWDVLRHLRDFAENYRERIKEYQQLEEQGRLVKLPCKVGDTVWQIMVVGVQGKNIQYGIFRAVVTKISVDYQMNFLLSTITEYGERYRNEVTSTAIGETMFFTKSEAEAKLEELRGGENGN
jgi:hypothetical protein|nr:MAG TPA: hypothetical protein [Bacteriophage sp.]